MWTGPAMKTFRKAIFISLFTIFFTGCNPGKTESEIALSTATNEPFPTPEIFTPTPFPDPVLVISGQEEVVFDWTTDSCEPGNLPDLPTRAIQDSEGQVQLILSHFTNYRMIGEDLNNLTLDCNPIMKSKQDPDPALYIDEQWIASPYTEDGKTIYALIHNEYQGNSHPGQCPENSYFPCWDNSITLAISIDHGKTYSEAVEPSEHLIARLPYPYKAGAGPDGFRNPSNIIKGPDNYFYAFFNAIGYESDEQWVCLMRTKDLALPGSWRFWDGSAFEGQFADPYKDDINNPKEHICTPIDKENIGASLNDSITYNTYLNRYVLIGISADWLVDREVWGFYYSFSDDLIHWTRRKLLHEMPLPWTVEDFREVMYLYPSLLDPESESRNFETTDNTAFLYYTRLNFGQGNLDRDLIRVPVEFFSSAETVQISAPIAEYGSIDAVSLNIIKKEFKVKPTTPLELTMIWEANTVVQVANFLANAQFKIYLDGELLPDVMNYWSDIGVSGDNFNSQMLYPIGVLDPGAHQVDVQISVAETIDDGFGNEYSGTFFYNTLLIEVAE